MKHSIPITDLPRGKAMSDAIDQCVHCGFCLAACPTYEVLGEEMDSPRGRIYLMKEVMEGGLEPEEAQPYIDRCLGCVGCVPACPSGVQYGDLITSYRSMIEAERKRTMIDTVARTLVRETLPYPRRFRLAAATGALGRLVERALPDKIGAMLGLLPDRLPAAKPLPDVYPAQGERRARVALLAGCVQQVLAPDINWATLEVLAANGVETIIPKGQGCCGSILMHIGETDRAMSLAKTNMQVFPDDVDAIITNAAGCGSGMHEYPLLFMDRPEEAQANAFSAKVMDISVFLDQLGLIAPPENQPERVVAYHDACHLAHAQGVTSPPRNLLKSIPNLTLKELNDDALCCGSAGTYNIEQPEIAKQLGRRKAAAIEATGATIVVSGNIGCQTQILNHLTAEIQVMHTLELLAEAYRATP